jgi:hypothetical protein
MSVTRVWWIHPGKLTLFFIMPMYVFIVYIVPALWPQVILLKGDYYIQGFYAAIGLAMLSTLAVGGFLGARVSFDRPAPAGYEISPLGISLIGAVALIAYVIWSFPVLLHGRVNLERGELNQTPGITSFNQMGIAFCLCYLNCALAGGQTFPIYVRLQVVAIAFFTIVRVFLWMERLAAIELGVSAVVVGLTYGRFRGTAVLRLRAILTKIGPYAAVPALFLAFTFTEYFRSWKTYSRTQSLPLLDFMVQRVTSYYFTALNNGAGLLTTRSSEWPSFRFIFVAEWIYKLPAGIGDGLYALANGGQEHPAASFLNSYATPEFNNMSGIFTIIYDVGVVGGLLYFLGMGIAAGMLYRSMIRGGSRGGMIYPIVVVAILEVMRVPYLNCTRVVTLFVGTFLLLAQMRPRRVLRIASVEGLQGAGATL